MQRSNAQPPPGTMPSSTAARVAFRASVTLSFFSFTSTSLVPPTYKTQATRKGLHKEPVQENTAGYGTAAAKFNSQLESLTAKCQKAKPCSPIPAAFFCTTTLKPKHTVLVDYFIKFLIPRCSTVRNQIPYPNQLLRL